MKTIHVRQWVLVLAFLSVTIVWVMINSINTRNYSRRFGTALSRRYPSLERDLVDISSTMKPPPKKGFFQLNPDKNESFARSNIQFIQDYEFLNDLLKGTPNGFYVEVGALNGTKYSETLSLEYRGWEGLLVEPIPLNYVHLELIKRKAWIHHGCLSAKNESMYSLFPMNGGASGWDFGGGTIPVKCYPLVSYLLALNRTSIDLFVLDIDSVDKEVLLAFPHDLLPIDVIQVESWRAVDMFDFLADQGYRRIFHLYPEKKPKTSNVDVWIRKDGPYGHITKESHP